MKNRPCSALRTYGFTLIELMLSTLIATLLIAGALRLLVNGRIAWQTAQNVATLEERAAYALTALEQDIALAGYWGILSDSRAIAVQPDVTARCSGRDVTAWALDFDAPVQADNGTFTLPCTAFAALVTGADTLTIRHASPLPTAAADGRIQLYANHHDGVVFQSGSAPVATTGTGETYNLEVHAWHLVRNSTEMNLPALRRFALVAGGTMQNQEIIPGIENFQVTLGVDRDADGVVDGFVNPDATANNPVMAVRYWLLLRSAKPEPGHIDDGPWQSIDTNARTPMHPGDRYRRITAQRTVWLRNLASR